MSAFIWRRKGEGSKTPRRDQIKANRRVSIASPHAVSSAGQSGTILRVYLLDGSIRAVRITAETNCRNVILELKKQLHLENDAFYSLYNAGSNLHAEARRIDDEDVISHIVGAKEFMDEGRHILFRRRIYIPLSTLTEEELHVELPSEGAHMLAWLEAIEMSLTILPEFEQQRNLVLLAALRMQDEYGDFHPEDEIKHRKHLSKHLAQYLTSFEQAKAAIDTIIGNWKDLVGMTKLKVQQQFIEICKDSPLYGAIVFDAECKVKTSKMGSQPAIMHQVARIAVACNGLHLLGPKWASANDPRPSSQVHPMAHIGKWTVSPSGTIFAFCDDAEGYNYYVKCSTVEGTKELFCITDDYMSILHSPDSDQVTAAKIEDLGYMHLKAPSVRRQSLHRVRTETFNHEKMTTENDDSSSAELPKGWEKFWSEEHQMYYYHSKDTGKSAWTFEDIQAAVPTPGGKLVAQPVGPEQEHNYHMWSEAFLSIGFSAETSTIYASILAAANMGHDNLITLTTDQLVSLNITDKADISRIIHLSELAAQLDDEIGYGKATQNTSGGNAGEKEAGGEETTAGDTNDEWERLEDPNTGKYYYWNKMTNVTSWVNPHAAAQVKSVAHKHRHQVIASESVDNEGYEKKVYYKDASAAQLIQGALKDNFVFESLDDKDRAELSDAFFQRQVPAGINVIEQGDKGDYFYVVEKGSFDIFVDSQKVVEITAGGSFGELALLYNCPRAATVRSAVDGVLWAIDRSSFKHIIKDASEAAYKSAKEALQDVHILRTLKENQLDAIASAVKITRFKAGDYIIRKGDQGEIFYMVKDGEVMCVIPPDPSKGRRKSKPIKLVKGQYFGERALQRGEPRAADVVCLSETCTCMTLDRQAFQTLLGPLHQLIANNVAVSYLQTIPSFQDKRAEELYAIAELVEEKEFSAGAVIQDEGKPVENLYIIREGDAVVYHDDQHVANLCAGQFFNDTAMPSSRQSVMAFNQVSVMCVPLSATNELAVRNQRWSVAITSPDTKVQKKEKVLNPYGIRFEDLHEIKVLGEGSFGRVSLVQVQRPEESFSEPWALKRMSKAVIDKMKQKKNIMNEKKILALLDHPFVLALEATFQDSRSLYMLLEIVPGGELFNYLDQQEGGIVPATSAWFYMACMVSAFNHIHSQNVIYRDIKSENVMIDREGYLKVIDFGFAKVIENRTHTLLGTPEYFAPEVLKGKGYGFPVDNWGIGILLFEMLVGSTPFAAEDTAVVCKRILHNDVLIPATVTDQHCRDLLTKLLVKDPLKRMGSSTKRTKEIMAHSWFSSMDWNALEAKSYDAPWTPTLNGGFDTVEVEQYWEDHVEVEVYENDSSWCAEF
jgi:CRP-like cAMP-binding protein